MNGASAPAYATSPGGILLVLAIMLPVIALLGMMVLKPSHARGIVLVAVATGFALALAIVISVAGPSESLIYVVGAWQPPLGLALRADGLSAVLIALTALIVAATALFARGLLASDAAGPDGRLATAFWMLLMGLWAAMVLAVTAQDLFNLYVALELLTFAAVPMVCLSGRPETVAAALRYLIFALIGSLFYLLGAALIYGVHGTLDLRLLAMAGEAPAPVRVALALMIAGLLAKAALFPLHLWLPPAHAGAPPMASAVLSALVVKAPVVLILRLVVDVAPAAAAAILGQVLAALGAASILVCSVMALRQARLKAMIAYSTVAQVGYLFLVFPLAAGTDSLPPWATPAWTGGVLQLVSHALAKAAMFMAAGLVAAAAGHDRIDRLDGFGRALPLSATAIGLAGLSLMGLPPSGGFVAKWLLLTAALGGGHVWLAATMLAGGVLAGLYVLRVIERAFARSERAFPVVRAVPRRLELVPLALAVLALLLGFVPLEPLALLAIGRPDAAAGSLP